MDRQTARVYNETIDVPKTLQYYFFRLLKKEMQFRFLEIEKRGTVFAAGKERSPIQRFEVVVSFTLIESLILVERPRSELIPREYRR